MSCCRLNVRRAVRISDLFERRRIAAALFESLLGRLATAVVLINDKGHVLFANAAAHHLLDAYAVGRIVGNRLSLASIRLSELVAGVAQRHAFVALLPEQGDGGSRLGLTAFALRGDLGRTYGTPIALSGERTAPKPLPALLAAMFDLTGGELRVLLALLDGKAPDMIAAEFGISIATVRSHLARLFAKTDAVSQADLIRKVTAVLPPLSGA